MIPHDPECTCNCCTYEASIDHEDECMHDDADMLAELEQDKPHLFPPELAY